MDEFYFFPLYVSVAQLTLIICKDFVEKNGGEIWLETKKGLGSKFFFTVPC